jgi:hypothetical protein
LDSGWLNQALDIVTEAGGSLRMTTLSLAESKEQASRALLRVVAPSWECLEGILVELWRSVQSRLNRNESSNGCPTHLRSNESCVRSESWEIGSSRRPQSDR